MGAVISVVRCAVWDPTEGQAPLHPPPPVEDCVEQRYWSIVNAKLEDGDLNNTGRPDWLDEQKLSEAREMHRHFWPFINNAQVMSLFLSFVFTENVKPLIFTGRSDTADRARRRYLETALYTNSWALGDLWDPQDPACQNVERVRRQHAAVARALADRDLSQVQLPDGQVSSERRHLFSSVSQDLTQCPVLGTCSASDPPPAAGCPMKAISQFGMVQTQWLFVGLILLHPERYGLAGASERQMECFVHLWRCIGHRLGVRDDLNLCAGSLQQTRALCWLIEQRLMLPQLRHLSADWERMTRALYGGLGQAFGMCHYHAWLLYLLHDVLGLHVPRLYSSLSWWGYYKYRVMRAVFYESNAGIRLSPLILSRVKNEFRTGAEKEDFGPHLMYVFDLL